MPADTASHRSPRSTRPAPEIEVVNEGAETAKRVGESAGLVGAECLTLCSDTLSAVVDSASRSSQVLAGIGLSCFENYSACVAEMSEIGREAVTCRSPADVVNVQKKAMESVSRSLEASGKLYLEMFGAWSKAYQPLLARTMDAPERLFRAVADGDLRDVADLSLREVA
jgi:hypothetical protein